MRRVSVLKPEYGPTLLELLAPRSLAVKIAAGAVALALLVAAAAIALGSRADETQLIVRKPITFNFVYGPQFHEVRQRGTLAALRHDGGGLFLDSFVVRDLTLPAYRGAVGGVLPVYIERYRSALARRYSDFEYVNEGRVRINNGIGYSLTFRARLGTRRLYGRHLLLVEDDPDGRRHGVIVELESTPKAGTPRAEEIGNAGALKMPLRSFRFGTERKGGEA